VLRNTTNYSHLAMPETFGVNMITYGLDSCFKPWYTDGTYSGLWQQLQELCDIDPELPELIKLTFILKYNAN
jgi:hypothetical protein